MKKRNFLSCLLIIAIVLATISPTVLFAAEDIAQDEQVYDETYTEETEEYVEETPEAYDWTIETNELKKWPQGPRVEAEGATVMDLDTGAFLYSKNAEAKLYPASITKIMTMLVALEHISDSDLDTKVKASESALAPIDSDSSQIWLSVGEKITVRSALYAIMLASANDAANVIAEYVGGSMDNFVKMMNDKAKELGCVNTHFVNPHGLHNKKHYTCAHDMALIAQAAFQIPLFRKITKTVEYKIPKTKYMKEDRWLVNHQKMLYEDGEFTYKNCEGGKTGFTDEAWNTLVTYAKKDGIDPLLILPGFSRNICKVRHIDPVWCHPDLLRRTAKIDLQKFCTFIEACYRICFLISQKRHLFELLDPDVFVDTFDPVCLDQLLLSLSGVNAMLRDQKRTVMEMLCRTAEHTGISGCHAVIEICLRHFHLQCPEKRQIDRSNRPQEIRKNDIGILSLITLPDNLKEIRSHQKIIHRHAFSLEQIKDHTPFDFPVHNQIRQFGAFLLREMETLSYFSLSLSFFPLAVLQIQFIDLRQILRQFIHKLASHGSVCHDRQQNKFNIWK